MSVKATTWAWSQDVTPTQKLVLLALADHAWQDGTNAFPSIERLARMTGLADRSVRRAIDDKAKPGLVQLGLVKKELNAGGTADYREDRRPNLYTLAVREDTVSPRPLHGGTVTTVRGDADDKTGGHSVSQTKDKNHVNNPSCADQSLTPAMDIVGQAEKWSDLSEADFIAYFADRGITDEQSIALALEARSKSLMAAAL